MDEYSANQKIFDYLKNCSEQSSLAHAYSFIGSNNDDKIELLTRFLLFFMPSESIFHPDIKIIEPEENVIKIKAIREARAWASMTPISSDKKILIIKSAGAMNAEAQNAFLKVLEEPAENTYIFLLIGHRKQILPTVYSRVAPIYFVKGKYQYQNKDSSLIQKILSTDDKSERMRIWIEAKLEKEQISDWVKNSIPYLRKALLERKSKDLAKGLQSIISSFENPLNQNWKLVAENLIISI